MPVLGQSVEEVRILQWLKNEGDPVAVGENLAEIETDKVSTFFESTEAGFVRQLLVPADSFVAVETPVVVITDTRDERWNDPDSPVEAVAPDVVLSPRARRVAEEQGIDVRELVGRGTGPNGRVQEKDVLSLTSERDAAAALGAEIAGRGVKASPLARAVAGNAGIDLASVAGSGRGGRVVAEDVHASAAPVRSGTRTVVLSGLRKRVADNLQRSVQRAPHVTLHLSVDMGAASELRQTLLPAVEARCGSRLSPTDIMLKATALALTEHPAVNAHIEGDTITLFEAVDIGLAVSLGDDGLIVPVLRDVATKGLVQIARERDDLASRARSGRLSAAEIQNATFTVTNLGGYGIETFDPIISPPQVAILGVGTIADAVVARHGVPAVRPMMALSLSFDHRAIDGAPAAAFLARVKEILETPALLLL